MKPRTFLSPLLCIAMTTAGATLSVADGRPDPVGGQVLTPDTSIEHADHIGHVAHTNTKILFPTGGMDNVHPPSGGAGEEIKIKASKASKKVAFRVAKGLSEAI